MMKRYEKEGLDRADFYRRKLGGLAEHRWLRVRTALPRANC